MERIRCSRPSPALVVAGIALVVALAGTAIAGPLAGKSALSKSEKKQTRNIAASEIKKAATGLSVANASTVDGVNASDLKTSSAYGQDGSVIASLGNTDVTVATATITLQSTSRILATGSAELFGAESGEVADCLIVIDGSPGLNFSSEPDDIGTNNQHTISVNHAATRPAGTWVANLRCKATTGTVGKDDAAISLYGLGT